MAAKSDPYVLTMGAGNPDQSDGQVDALKGFFENSVRFCLLLVTPVAVHILNFLVPMKESGFFIECGAYNGEVLSNTLWFEKELGWNGLLIEADPYNFRELRKKNRKAWHANVCLSPTQFPGKVRGIAHPIMVKYKWISVFQLNFYVDPEGDGTLSGLRSRDMVKQPVPVDCFPLYTLLAAVNQTVVDLFSLDIEGLELQILKTIPFDKIAFKFIIVENWEPHALRQFMNSQGFKLFRHIYAGKSNDLIFAHPSMVPSDFIEPDLLQAPSWV